MSESGRYYITDLETGRKFCVEPIGSDHSADWGDIDPATKKVTGKYGEKHRGNIDEKDSIITEENNFINIKDLKAGESPHDYINKLLNKNNKI